MLRKLFKRKPKQNSNVDYYKSSSEIPFDVFIEIVITDDVTLLNKGSQPMPPDFYVAVWMDIYEEYIRELSPTYVADMQEQIEVGSKRLEYEIVEMCVKALRISYDKEMVEILREKGFDFEFNLNDIDSYLKDLARVTTRSKFWVLELKEYYEGKSKEVNKDYKIDRVYFAKAIAELSKYSEYEIKPKEISALDFAVRYRGMIEYYNSMNKKTNK